MTESAEQRAERLRQSISDGKRDLDIAMEQLKSVSREGIGIGHFMATDPWPWLVVAGFAGVLLALRDGK